VDFTQTRDGGETAGVEQFPVDDLIGVNVVASSRGTVLTVSPAGEIDFVTAPVLRSALLNCLRPPCRQVIVDLDGLTFLSCAGLTVLAEAHHLAQADGIDFTLRGGHRAVLRPLQLTGLWKQLAPHPG
jgi:anti-sigma B factor antagonist